jgi:hypothetical protein
VGQGFSPDVRVKARTHMRIDTRLFLDKNYAVRLFAGEDSGVLRDMPSRMFLQGLQKRSRLG